MIPGDDYPEIIIAWVTARTGEKPLVVESYFQKAIQLNPRFAFWHKDFGDYYVNIDKTKLAEDEYRKALALYPNNPDFMAMAAKVRRYQGDLKDAEDMTNKAMAVSGNHQNVLWEMFYIKSDQGDHQRVRNILQQLVLAYQDQSARMILQRMKAEPQK
jgi:Flp pilus assembly protein TadD